MITDANVVNELRADWDGVRRMHGRMQRLCVVTFADGAMTGPALGEVLYNLPLLLASDVLRSVLRQMKREGLFACPRADLGLMVEAARTALPWDDWSMIREGVRRRNEVAHDGRLFSASQCIADTEAIGKQLAAWGVIDPAAAALTDDWC